MEDIACAVGVDHLVLRYRQRRQVAVIALLVDPDETLVAERDAADLDALLAQELAQRRRVYAELLAQPLRADRDVDEFQELVRVRAQTAAVERGEDAGLAAQLRIVDRGIGLMAVEVQRAAAGQIERRDRMQIIVVAAADDRPHALVRHHEGERGLLDLTSMHRDPVLRRHVEKHAREPVVGERGHQIGHDPELGAAERGRDRVTAETDRIVPRDDLLVAGRDFVDQEGHVDVGLADKERVHGMIRSGGRASTLC